MIKVFRIIVDLFGGNMHEENCVRQIIEMEKQEKQKTLTYDRGTSVW